MRSCPPASVVLIGFTTVILSAGSACLGDRCGPDEELKEGACYPLTNDGHSIFLINWNPQSPLRKQFDDRVLKDETPDQVAAYWIDRRLRGGGSPPRSTSSATLIQSIIARYPDAISFVPASDVKLGVKILRLEGKLPGERGYPLLFD